MNSSFIFFIFFSFVLVALSLFSLFFFRQLKEIRGYFEWSQSIFYLLGSVFILVSLCLAYFIYLYFSTTLAILVFVLFNGTALFLLGRASSILRRKR
ncbi:MAG: hypothetical protein A2156_07420 [Deltaproteobacteria bacterium RBG_16_48_10]|nr:MAG: hypothetical protein A2156_07420 [Deltaproteobacteria bacterium RBG_16_48_10]